MNYYTRIPKDVRERNAADIKKFDKSVLDTALKHQEHGLAVHWNRAASKAPVAAVWNDAPISTSKELMESHQSSFNVGFRAGKFSIVRGHFVGVLDVDIKHPDFEAEANAAANQLMEGKFDPTVVSGSCVGRHQYLLVVPGSIPDKAATTLRQSDVSVKDGKVVPKGTPGSKPAWTVEFLYTGKNVVMPPSIHPDTGNQYCWANGIDMGKLMPILESMVDLLNANHEVDWHEPELIKFDLLPVAKFCAELLPKVLRDFVYDIADRTQCPVDFVAVVVVQTICVAIGNACAIRPKQFDDWCEFVNLWAAIVGRPGQLKTPAKNAGSEPIKWLEWAAQQAYEADMLFFENAQIDRELKIQTLKSIKTRTPEQQQELSELLKEKPVKPTLRRYRSSDATIEKLAELLNENPRGILVDRDELVGLLAIFQKAGHEADRSFYLEGWNGNGKFIVDRIGRGTTIVEHLTLLVFGSIQPAKLQRYLHESLYGLGNDGFLQRFQLSVYPDDNPAWSIVDREPDRAALEAVIDLVRKLADCDFVLLGAQLEEHRPTPFFRYSEDAQAVFNDWYVALGQKVAAEELAIVAEHLGKYRKLVPALSLVFHLVDLATGDTQKSSPVTLIALTRAIAWSEYLETHARRIYHMAIDIREDAVKSLANKLAKGDLQDGFTERDVYIKQWSNLSDPELVEAACNELEQAGWLRRIQRDKKALGRPTVRYEINPAVVGRKV